MANRLHEWLNCLSLGEYFDNFLTSGLYDIEQLIQNMNTNDRLYYEDIFNIGIHKAGHIFKILTQLEKDAELISDKIYFTIFGNYTNNRYSLQSLRISSEKYVCCGTFNHIKTTKNKLSKDIIDFLKRMSLLESRKNFIYNGFDSIEYLYLQMFSFYPITDNILKDNFHIYDRNSREVILKQLNEGKFYYL